MRKLIVVVLLLVLALTTSFVRAQAPLTSVEVLIQMGTPQEGGIPNSYLADTRYSCTKLKVGKIVNSFLGLNFQVLGAVRPISARYFDQQCRVSGETGKLRIYKDGSLTYMDASVISGIWKYSTKTPAMKIGNATLWTTFKWIPNLHYHLLAVDHIVDFTKLGDGSANPDEGKDYSKESLQGLNVAAFLWIQMRDTNDSRELADESTWQLMPLLQYDNDGALSMYLPSGHLVHFEVNCEGAGDNVPMAKSGNYYDGVLTCGGVNSGAEFFSVQPDQRYDGIFQ